jgi:hypothetical protein
VGRHLADAALWIAITSFLATFSVHKALDEHGKEIPVIPKFTTGVAMFADFLLCILRVQLISVISVILRHFPAELSRDSKMHLWRS